MFSLEWVLYVFTINLFIIYLLKEIVFCFNIQL